LARVAKRHPVGRKLIVAPNVAAGRELLRRLSLTHGGWIGFEVTTPRPLALRLARGSMESAALSALDAFEEQSLLDRALDSALSAAGGGLGELSEGVGFRERVHDAISAMRLAGITPAHLDRARLIDGRKRLFLLHVLRRYERLLTERGRADTASILSLALTALEDAGGRLPATLDADVVLLVPGLGTRGLTGRLISALGARGAKVLETDPVLGLEQPEAVLWNRRKEPAPGSRLFASGPTPPANGSEHVGGALDIDFFRAASINEELRGVLRRIAARGLRWDQVEIVSADPAAYGSALHAIATRLGVPVTYAVGLPVERTRTGRVVRAYLEWIEEGFQAEPIRRLLEAGDLRPRARHAPPAAVLARRFRSLRVGWGRMRYRDQIRGALSGLDRLQPGHRESAEVFERKRDRARDELRAIRSMLYPALKATPAVPDRAGTGGHPVSPAELARGLRAFLRSVPKGRGPDRTARDEVGAILERVEAVLRRRTDFRAAIAILRRHLDVRVRARSADSDPDELGAPWSSRGGALHLTDFEHGGYTGREAVFLVGIDADRVPGPGGQDPVLLDGDRRVLGGELPTSTELMQERMFRLAALFARLRGSVTMSYTSWSASEARIAAPSPVLLLGLRLARRDPDLTFIDLEEALGRVVSAIPPVTSPALDQDDVWMSALGPDGVLRTGVEAVRRAFPRLDRGLTSHELRLGGTPGPIHGVVAPRPEDLDPRRNPDLVLSASRLEALGSCPLKYLHDSVLRLRPPDDPELDPDRWLDPRRRGGLLHRVFEATLRRARTEGIRLEDPAFESLALEVLGEGVVHARHAVPVPGQGALRRETVELEEDVRSFVRLIREQGDAWIYVERTFGLGDDEPVALEIEGGSLRLRGAIDRVDEDLRGVRVIDYKTGTARDYQSGTGTFNGGRRLQHAIYARVAESVLGGPVVAGEYHHPTRRGQNQVFAYDRMRLAGLDAILGHMFDGVAAGAFVPTDQADDCGFCDYAEICRAHRSGWGTVTSPLAEWSSEHLNMGLQPALASLKRVRTFEE
jgi:ATP-dependent helicase/nuclease subunit B